MGDGRGSVLIRYRFVIQASMDALTWVVALLAATALRLDLSFRGVDWWETVALLPVAGAVQVGMGAAFGLYVGRYRFGGFDEVAAVAKSVLVTTAVVYVVNFAVFDHFVPRSAVIGAGLIAFVVMGGTRYGWRLYLERQNRPGEHAQPVVVFGAGEGGVQAVTSMLRNPDSPYRPVALLDDNTAKRQLTISGIRVEGTREELDQVARRHGARAIVIGIPSASASLVSELTDLSVDAGLRVFVLPPVRELFTGLVDVADIRPLELADLLGRHEIDTDVAAIASYLADRRVLITGAGGSIGAELACQVERFGPARLVLLDRDESALHGLQLRMDGRALLDSPDLVVCDVRDAEAIDRVVAEHRPEVLFHAAALKHLPLLERHAAEAIKTNVWGTANVLEAAVRHDVGRFINISTDKAAEPTSVLGYSKGLAERLTARAGTEGDGTYLSVRFGNVLGSRGSVLTAFQAQIRDGGPVTVTDPDVTRFFMTVEEAVQLVIQAGAVGRDGEALVLDLGEPVRIADLAERLVAQADRDVDIVYTGLRPGEKLHETLVGADEASRQGPHPLIRHIMVPPLERGELAMLDLALDEAQLRQRLATLAGDRTAAEG
jgi:FlaA1/EpsC-like NDP-sugar epimerase